MKKKLLIFGADGNLGRAAAKILLLKNYDEIFLFVIHKEKIDFDSPKIKIIGIENLIEEANVKRAFDQIGAEKEDEIFLFSSIGAFAGGNFIKDTGYGEWKKMFNINLNINFLIGKYFSLLCGKCAGGSICFTSAFTSLNPGIKKAAYETSKAALNTFIHILDLEGKEMNFSVNAVAPFALDTPLNREWIKNEKELTKLSDIAETVNSLFDNRHFTSGNIIKMNGSR